MSKPIVHVAVALLFYHSKVLVGWREAKQHQGNKYEFPAEKLKGMKLLKKPVGVKFMKKSGLA